MFKKLSVALLLVVMVLTPTVVLALAPGTPFFWMTVDPDHASVAAGGSATFKISALSQESFEGNAKFSVDSPPAGVTVTFDPNPVFIPGFDFGYVDVKVDVASSVPAGAITLNIIGKDVKGVGKDNSPVTIALTITAGSATTTTAASTTATTTGSTTATTTAASTTAATITSTVTSTVTSIITTRTSSINSITSIQSFDQVGELMYPLVTIIAVVVIIAAAALMFRSRGKSV